MDIGDGKKKRSMSYAANGNPDMKVTVVGVGNLGSVLVKALLNTAITQKDTLSLYNRSMTEYLEQLKEEGISVRGPRKSTDERHECDLILFAVKPQEAESAIAPWANSIAPSTVVVSVMAGLQIAALSKFLGGHRTVVRAMPNLGAYVGRSATAYFSPPDIDPECVRVVRTVLSAFGEIYELLEEGMLDAATAIAGSGPAYVCWLAEQMISAAIDFGFEREQAVDLVVQTLLGTAEVLHQRHDEPAVVRERVTSRGGTTAAALSVLDAGNAMELFDRALRSAEARSRELSNQLSKN
jgi:pyrroline-5-carboxylate reductase